MFSISINCSGRNLSLRTRRVMLTPGGQEVIQLDMVQSLHLADLLVRDLREEEKGILAGLLDKLVQFHDGVYRQMEKEKIITSYNL